MRSKVVWSKSPRKNPLEERSLEPYGAAAPEVRARMVVVKKSFIVMMLVEWWLLETGG
jgi:hypothetical protein